MARTVRNAKLDTRSARIKLEERREPYWTSISRGCALGYRRGSKGGTWVARLRAPDGKQHYEALGATDDARDADGLIVFSFAQAQRRASEFFEARSWALSGETPPDKSPYTVERALKDYFASREQRGSKGVPADRYAANARIIPEIGSIEVARLTSARIKTWRQTVETSAKLVRQKKGAAPAQRVAINPADAEVVRARKATSNRVLTILKAALNHAFAENKVASDQAWRQVKAHREVDVPLVRFLSDEECRRLVAAAEGRFRDLVCGALVTGARYGELARMKVADFNAASGFVTVRLSKAGKSRHIALNDEGQRLFATMTKDCGPQSLIFARGDDKAWKASEQQRPIKEASRVAGIDPPANFHVLRHTYASALAMKGVSMKVIADQLGHADTRITERHYAHLGPSYVADVVRAAMPGMGIVA